MMTDDGFDGEGFVSDIEPQLVEFSELSHYIIRKQIKDMNIDLKSMTAREADVLIDKVGDALSSFFGKEGTKLVKRFMRKKLKKYAPIYFKRKYEP